MMTGLFRLSCCLYLVAYSFFNRAAEIISLSVRVGQGIFLWWELFFDASAGA